MGWVWIWELDTEMVESRLCCFVKTNTENIVVQGHIAVVPVHLL